jgi:SagB-type dehydrogenase family enzyme
MHRGIVLATALAAAVAAAAPPPDSGRVIKLPPPKRDGGKPLMEALRDRQTRREFSEKGLTPEQLSNLLWAAFGINRPDSGRRTAPSAVNWQEIAIYVARASGVWLYDAKAHALRRVLAEDLRAAAGKQHFVGTAPVVLIYVADRSRMGSAAEADKDFYSATDTGFISENVYLFCASENLATVVVGSLDRAALAERMGLRPEQRVILTQPVGFPP